MRPRGSRLRESVVRRALADGVPLWFVREWIVDPKGLDADDELDRNAPSETHARERARALRASGKLAGAFLRRNLRYAYGGWEWDEVQLDSDEEVDGLSLEE